MFKIDPQRLIGDTIRLEVLAEEHREPLRKAANDEKIWEWMLFDGYKQFDIWFDRIRKHQQSGNYLAFAVINNEDNQVIGSNSYTTNLASHKRFQIVQTWYHPSVWGSKVNPECHYLLMRYAFEDLDINRIELTCDTRNKRSYAAILKLGFTEEGVLREHYITHKGYTRDSITFSMLAKEWPENREKIEKRIK